MAKQGALSALSNGGLSELWARLRFLFMAIIVYRIGAHIPVPGINPDRLADLFRQNEGTILSLFNMFSGKNYSLTEVYKMRIFKKIFLDVFLTERLKH
jgi:preprotein translocase subunit SecY